MSPEHMHIGTSISRSRCRYLDPLAWGLYGIIVTQMGAVTQTVELSDGGHVSISSYLLQTYNYDYSFRWQVRCLFAHCNEGRSAKVLSSCTHMSGRWAAVQSQKLQPVQTQAGHQDVWAAVADQFIAVRNG